MPNKNLTKDQQPLGIQRYGPQQIRLTLLLYGMGGLSESQKELWKHLRFGGNQPSMICGQFALNRCVKAGLMRYEPKVNRKRKVRLTQRGYLLAWRELGMYQPRKSEQNASKKPDHSAEQSGQAPY